MDKIQALLKAPKGQTNAFGKYKYRSCEDIVEAVKPILAERGFSLNISDEVVMLGDRFYVKATAKVIAKIVVSDVVKNITVGESSAYAREALSKKGMDESQITGAASSYARKYALNGLFAIDDTKDADTHEAAHEPAAQVDYQVKYASSIDAIKMGISGGELGGWSTAAEEWYSLPKHAQEGLWVATSKGGCFTTEERATMKTKEFRQSHFGIGEQ